jgi:hypothetical protein
MEKNKNSAAHDIVQYMSLWLRDHDNEFGKCLQGKNLKEILPLLNARYGSDFSLDENGTIHVSEFLYWLPVYMQRYNDSLKIAKRRKEYKTKEQQNESSQTKDS